MFLDSIAIILCEERALWSNGKHWNKPSYVDVFACVPACSVASVGSDLATLWTVARQPPLSMGFSRQEYWSGLPCPPPGDLPHAGIKPASLISSALTGGFFTTSSTWEASEAPINTCLTPTTPASLWYVLETELPRPSPSQSACPSACNADELCPGRGKL